MPPLSAQQATTRFASASAFARALYSALLYALAPVIVLRLCWRSRRQSGYLQHLSERFAFYPRRIKQHNEPPLLWLHAVSVGETRAAAPLIEALLSAYPQHQLLLTHMTPTGRASGLTYLERYPGRVKQAYLAYDFPGAARRFLQHYCPQLGLLMETELWPNLLAQARQLGVPMALINARLSLRSQRGYAKWPALTRPAFASLSFVSAQSQADAERIRQLGVSASPTSPTPSTLPTLSVCGNLKFDTQPDVQQLALGARYKQHLNTPQRRPILLAASTRDGEEALLLDQLPELMRIPGLLLVIVPRHPQRFDEVAALLVQRALRYCRRSAQQHVDPRDARYLAELPSAQTQVWLGDSMGELALYYSLADYALIGGSFLPFGGQNLIEAAACACPTVLGPHTFNFSQAADDAVACGAARRVADMASAVVLLKDLLQDPEQSQSMRAAALAFSQAHRGATARNLALIQAVLPSAAVSAPEAPLRLLR